MTNKFFLLLFLAAFSQSAFSQNGVAEKRPQAYLLSGGDTRPALSRPRTIKTAVAATAVENVVYQSKKNYSLERQAFDLINKERIQLGLAGLEWSDDIAEIARTHSENMANYGFFSHTDLNGLMVNDRADALGITKWRAIGENIAYNRGYQNPAISAVEKWMQSPAHRENLLNNRWRESAVGIAVTDDGTYYFTEVFILRK
ncbi:MAG: CAP domain-containing protein [Pyrinomonadaceae bacterium]|nr:CAP domain-containing protein [Pyrinomonadaceae bacterium]